MVEKTVILLAEDSEDDALLTRRAFKQAGLSHPLMTVENGEEAIAYLAGEGIYSDREKYPAPALLLLDLRLPRKGGFEVLKWVRQHPVWNSLIVVILTSSNFYKDINQAYDLGANSLVFKPADYSKLVEMVKLLDWFWLSLNTRPKIRLPAPASKPMIDSAPGIEQEQTEN
jgi:CheY-like chemotaxis protein